MILGAMRFHEYYSVPNQLQVLDAVEYQGAERKPLQGFAVSYRCEIITAPASGGLEVAIKNLR